MVVLSRKVRIRQWVGCPTTGLSGQILSQPFVSDGDTWVYVLYPDGLFACPLIDLVL